MQISDQTQAVLLLTAWLGKPDDGQPQPLSTAEWARFATWLHGQDRTPADVLANGHTLQGWDDPKISSERIGRLLERSAALAISVERWQRAGLWILSRSDPAYPRRLRRRLKQSAPPILYGAGNMSLLEAGGIAIVGARDASDEDLAFTKRLGAEVAAQAGNVVSGGARGVDEAAMLGALEAEGTAIGVLAENLLRASSSSRWRRHLMEDNLVLVSPFNPEARFTPANAMARNKYVYCLADAAVVAASAAGKGGTWAGATENLRKGWVLLWVRPHQGHAGNTELIRKGAGSLPPLESLDVSALSAVAPGNASEPAGLLLDVSAAVREDETGAGYDVPEPPAVEDVPQEPPEAVPAEAMTGQPSSAPADLDFYTFFLHRLRMETQAAALTVPELKERLQLTSAQLADWLKRAVEEEQAEKLTRPVRYRAATASQSTLGF
ncbi:MAG: DNA-processing protein DprA [Pseudomonadota bacterium]|nr:DNA-processing protein DprA [Pseudomonadota bacterium]